MTRQDKRRVLEAFDERLLMEMLLNPVDALCDTWDYGHYRTFRRLVWASDWQGLARALDACPETAVVETTRTLIKEASPRLYAMVTPWFVIPATRWWAARRSAGNRRGRAGCYVTPTN